MTLTERQLQSIAMLQLLLTLARYFKIIPDLLVTKVRNIFTQILRQDNNATSGTSFDRKHLSSVSFHETMTI